MFLLSSVDNQIFQYLKICLKWINWYVMLKEYAVVLNRIKKFKKDVIKQAWIVCDRSRKSIAKDEIQHTFNKRVNCLFKCIAVFKNEIVWHFQIIDSNHNHEFSLIKVEWSTGRVSNRYSCPRTFVERFVLEHAACRAKCSRTFCSITRF